MYFPSKRELFSDKEAEDVIAWTHWYKEYYKDPHIDRVLPLLHHLEETLFINDMFFVIISS